MEEMESYQIHRFRDRLALYLRRKDDKGAFRGATVYLSAADARRISAILNAGAWDIESVPFVNSTFESHEGTAEK